MKDQCPSCSDVWHLSRKLQTFEVIHKVDGDEIDLEILCDGKPIEGEWKGDTFVFWGRLG
jgi:hypothetical protein